MTSCLQDGNIQRPYHNAPIKDSIMKNRKKLFIQSAFLLCIIIGAIIIVGHQRPAPYKHDTGFVFGTVYNITYQSNTSLKRTSRPSSARLTSPYRRSTPSLSFRKSTATKTLWPTVCSPTCSQWHKRYPEKPAERSTSRWLRLSTHGVSDSSMTPNLRHKP